MPRERDDYLEQQNIAKQDDGQWVQNFNMLAVFLAVVGCGSAVLVAGWHPHYNLSLVAALASSGIVSGIILRRAGFPDQDRMSAARLKPSHVVAIFGSGLLVEINMVSLLPNATIDRLEAFLLICGSCFAGLVLVSVESALENVIAGLSAMALSHVFVVDGASTQPLLFWLSYFLPLAASFVALPLILKKNVGGFLGAGLISVTWAVLGNQEWSGTALSFWSVYTWIVLLALVALRILFSVISMPQSLKLRIIVFLLLSTFSVLLIASH